ncbi:MAG TPA: TolC family protein [Polyangiaceae bacterium]|nr:TolC family protein [Polyangiaceae bacterium]
MPRISPPAAPTRAFQCVGLALVLAVTAPAHALESKGAATPAVGRTASAHRLLRDHEGLASWLGDQSPVVRAARARARQASADVASSHLFPNPVLDASLSNIPITATTPPGLTFGETAIYGVGLSQTFELGKRGPRQDAAALRERAARLDVTSTLTDRVTTARDALGAAVHLGLRLGILQESLTDAERAATLERTRLEQKALSGMDYDRLLLDLAALRSEFARNQAEYTAARAECRAALGAECDLEGVTEDDLGDALPLTGAGSEDRLNARSDLRSLDLQASAARREADLASNRAIPDVTARVGYVHDRFIVSGDNMNTLNFGLELPLPVFDRGQHDARKANEHAVELEDERRALLVDARAALAGLLSRKAVLEANIDVLIKETLPRSDAVLTAAEQAFHQGGASMTDFLLARRSHIALTLTRLDQRFELFTVKNELHRVLGLAVPAHQGNQ